MNLKINEKYKVEIISQENEGLGVCKIDGIVVFAENGLPGDIGTVEITSIKKNYATGKMISFDKLSIQRNNPPCPYYPLCGGCDLEHQAYDYQLKFKEEKVKKALEHIGGFKNIEVSNIVFDKEYHYRNKVTLKVNGEKIGYYKHNTNEIVEIDHCLISNEFINKSISVLKSFISEYPSNSFISIVIKYSDGLMISIESKDNKLEKELKDNLISKLDNLKSLILNNKVLYGNNYIESKIDNLIFRLSANSFYQVNDNIMKKLYRKVVEYASNIKNDTIIDLYCGIGTITSLLSTYANKVIGIEVVEEAITNANENLKLNRINNVTFMNGKVEDLISNLIDKKIDTIVMDPPRSGVDRKALDSIIKINPKQIIYVSCNVTTLARDLKVLCDVGYNIIEITPFDMFPQTSHVECVVLLQRKSLEK